MEAAPLFPLQPPQRGVRDSVLSFSFEKARKASEPRIDPDVYPPTSFPITHKGATTGGGIIVYRLVHASA